MQLVFSEFQDQLVRGMAHRMNNILSLFHGYLDLLMDDQKLNPVMKEGLTRIRGGAREATDLMERINAISRPASCTAREMEPADFFRQLAPTLERMRTPKIEITVEWPRRRKGVVSREQIGTIGTRKTSQRLSSWPRKVRPA